MHVSAVRAGASGPVGACWIICVPGPHALVCVCTCWRACAISLQALCFWEGAEPLSHLGNNPVVCDFLMVTVSPRPPVTRAQTHTYPAPLGSCWLREFLRDCHVPLEWLANGLSSFRRKMVQETFLEIKFQYWFNFSKIQGR